MGGVFQVLWEEEGFNVMNVKIKHWEEHGIVILAEMFI